MYFKQTQLNKEQSAIIEAAKVELANHGFVLEPHIKVAFDYHGVGRGEFIRRYNVDFLTSEITGIHGHVITPYPDGNDRLRLSFYIEGQRYQPQISHIIFFIKYGFRPEVIDHVNRDTSDNTLQNLRPTDMSGNAKNRSVNKTSKTGICNISYVDSGKKKYRLNIAGFQAGFDNLADAIITRDAIRLDNGYFVAPDKPTAEFIEEYNDAQFAIMICSDDMPFDISEIIDIEELLGEAANDNNEPDDVDYFRKLNDDEDSEGLTEEQIAEVRECDILTRMTRKKTKSEEWYEEAAYFITNDKY